MPGEELAQPVGDRGLVEGLHVDVDRDDSGPGTGLDVAFAIDRIAPNDCRGADRFDCHLDLEMVAVTQRSKEVDLQPGGGQSELMLSEESRVIEIERTGEEFLHGDMEVVDQARVVDDPRGVEIAEANGESGAVAQVLESVTGARLWRPRRPRSLSCGGLALRLLAPLSAGRPYSRHPAADGGIGDRNQQQGDQGRCDQATDHDPRQ